MSQCVSVPVVFLDHHSPFLLMISNFFGSSLIQPDLVLMTVPCIGECMSGVWLCHLLLSFCHISFLPYHLTIPSYSIPNNSMCQVLIMKLLIKALLFLMLIQFHAKTYKFIKFVSHLQCSLLPHVVPGVVL